MRTLVLLALAGIAVPAAAEVETKGSLMVKLQRQFATYDLDRNGTINRAELQALMFRLAVSRGRGRSAQLGAVTEDWFRRADTDRNNRIAQVEAQVMLSAHYARYDPNRDGRISDAEQLGAADLILQGR